ncbi:MAG TPA: PAS domain S-box protein [Burkholderiales bacterium]|nr:PAS domain S-box protein [Burkholderiales bacterium]
MARYEDLSREELIRRLRELEAAQARADAQAESIALPVFGERERRQFETSGCPMRIFERGTLRYLAVNDAALRLYGYTREEFLRLTLRDTRHPREHQDMYSSLLEYTGAIKHWGPRRHITRSGEVIFVDIVTQDILYEGRLARLSLTLDLTERTRAEQRLREANEFLRGVIEASRDCIKVLDLQGRLLWINPGGLRLREAERDAALVGRSYLEFWEGADREAARRALERARCGEASRFTGRSPTLKGSVKWWDEIVTPVPGGEGRAEKLLVVSRDITEQRFALEALRESESQLELAIESSGLAMWDWDLRSGRVRRSERFARMLGYAPEELPQTRQAWQALVHPEDLPAVESAIRSHLEGATPHYVADYRVRSRNGEWVWVQSRARVTERDAAGTALRVVGFVHDITAQKQAEQRRLSQLLIQRDALVREVHHRIKNHLQGVAGLLRSKAREQPEIAPLIEAAVAQIQSVALVHGLQGRAPDAGVALGELLEAVGTGVPEAGGVQLARELDRAALGAVRLADSEAVPVALVINELVLNACKHRAIRPAREPIRIAAARRGQEVEIRVTNRGRLPRGFDYARGVKTGTGLELVRTLLPPGGARLSIEQSGRDVLAVLQLARPVIEPGEDSPQAPARPVREALAR